MNSYEKLASAVAVGFVVAAITDLVIHRQNIRRSLRGQKQHYLTKDRNPIHRLAHALASQTATGQVASEALHKVTLPARET